IVVLVVLHTRRSGLSPSSPHIGRCSLVSAAASIISSLSFQAASVPVFLYPASMYSFMFLFFFSSRRRHTRLVSDWSSDVCSSDLRVFHAGGARPGQLASGRGQCCERAGTRRGPGRAGGQGGGQRHRREIGRASCRERV